ncbi:MAG: anhydrase family 3 protein [Gammaproteobacteria bacterium]|nr:anhydrase family 3 protein [Gammaproteobacteria bacterium]
MEQSKSHSFYFAGSEKSRRDLFRAYIIISCFGIWACLSLNSFAEQIHLHSVREYLILAPLTFRGGLRIDRARMTIRTYTGNTPVLGAGVYIDATALVLGAVAIGAESSIWPMVVVRGDVNRITIGHHTNIQDASVLHVTHENEQAGEPGYPLTIGNYVSVGHKALLHACTIGDYCLIGMGAIIMDAAVVQEKVIVGAGSLVTPGKQLESGYLYVGNPARKVRPLTADELAYPEYLAMHYVELKNRHVGNT